MFHKLFDFKKRLMTIRDSHSLFVRATEELLNRLIELCERDSTQNNHIFCVIINRVDCAH
jgi:hypothetical protein